MLEFTLLEVSDDNSCIHIKANVVDASYTQDVYINKIVIVTKDNYDAINIPVKEKAVYYDDTLNVKKLNLSLTLNQLIGLKSLENQLLYVYVYTEDLPTVDVLKYPCGADKNLIVGALFNWYPLYQRGMNKFKAFKDSCNVNKDFIDFILLFKYLQLAIKCNDIPTINNIWDKLFLNSNTLTSNKCNCYAI